MSLQTTDLWFGGPRLPDAAFKSWVAGAGGQGPYAAFADEIVRVTPLLGTGMDDALPAWQAAWETANFTSTYWLNDGNSGGIGISGPGVPSPFSVPNNGAMSAHIHMANLWILCGRGLANLPSAISDCLGVAGVQSYFNSVQAAASDPNRPQMNTLADACLTYTSSSGSQECTYACDPNYATGICGRANGSGVNTPNQTPQGAPAGFAVANPIKVIDGPLNVRSGAGTTYSVLGQLQLGQNAVVTGAKVTNGGYDWYPVQCRVHGSPDFAVSGWVAGNYCELQTDAKNWTGDPAVASDLHNIVPNRSSSTLSYANAQQGHSCVKVVNAGSTTYEGCRFESGTNLGLTVQRFLVGSVALSGSGVIDYLTTRAVNTDNSVTDSTHPAGLTLSSTWKYVVVPTLVAPASGKTINLLQLHVVRQGVAAQTFYADDGYIVELV